MLDFTSALYLGMHHPSQSLRAWSQFTTGVPAALASPPEAGAVAQQLAKLQGCESGVLGTSTLHLLWDLFGLLARRRVEIYVDDGTYPIARWGIERAASRGVPVHEFAHHDAEAFRQKLRRYGGHHRPLLVTDGFCPDCGKAAPLPEYLESVRRFNGQMIVDDTQALGIFGHSPRPEAPYGRGGGGMLPHFQIRAQDIVLISSLAKAFGVPVALLSGSRAAVKEFELNSETRMHCSPPSVAVLRAAEHALVLNRELGDGLRSRVASLVDRFRQRMADAGFFLRGDLFPVQTLTSVNNEDIFNLHERLLGKGVRTVLRRARNGHSACVSFLITARHFTSLIDFAAAAVTEVLPGMSVRTAMEVMSDER